jgi:hypothetical protein
MASADRISPDTGGERRPARDIELSVDERDDLLNVCAQVFNNERSADRILDRIGFPRGRRPAWVYANPLDVWSEIFVELDNGILPSGLPYWSLLRAAFRVYSGNPVLRLMAERHGLVEPGPPGYAGYPADTAGSAARESQELRGHVFISYVREDSADVDQLQQVLQTAGVRVWRDTADLWPGEDWRVKIRRAITDDALVFLACFSRRGLARKRSYQNEELALAIDQLRLRSPSEPWLIPVRFDDCEIPDIDIGGGRTLGSIQRADLFGERIDDGFARLSGAVLRILGNG